MALSGVIVTTDSAHAAAAFDVAAAEGLVLHDQAVYAYALVFSDEVIGALFTYTHEAPARFSFDVVVALEHRNQGLGRRLVRLGLTHYARAVAQTRQLYLIAVHPATCKLNAEFGLRRLEVRGDHQIWVAP